MCSPRIVPYIAAGYPMLLGGSLAIMVKIKIDFRPMTLRRRVFPVLRFGWLVDHGQQLAR
jgi:hypothetical protein